MSRPKPEEPRWPLAALALYALALAALGWRISFEDWDGVKTIQNALLVWKVPDLGLPLDLKRPPLAWLPLSPVLAASYALGGATGALRAARLFMPFVLAGVLYACRRFFGLRHEPRVAWLLVLLLALNPLAVQFAPFVNLDIPAMLGTLVFLWAARRWLRERTPRAFALLAAACTAAFLFKYHLGLLLLGPMAVEARARRWTSRVWALPAVVWLGSVAALGVLVCWAARAEPRAWLFAWRELWQNFSFNVLTPKESTPALYALTLARELGPALAALAGWGWWTWLRSREDEDFLYAASLAGPLLAMSLLVPNREARYALPLMPLLYGAVGAGVEALREWLPTGQSARWQALVAGALLLPWGELARVTRYLASEPSMHTDVPWALGRLAAGRAAPGECVAWKEGDLLLRAEDPVFRYEPALALGAPTFRFFSPLPVREVRGGPAEAGACRAAVTVVPRYGPEGERWSGAPLARVYAGASDAGVPLWDVLDAGVVPSRRRG